MFLLNVSQNISLLPGNKQWAIMGPCLSYLISFLPIDHHPSPQIIISADTLSLVHFKILLQWFEPNG